jgi:hypothetical protein
VALFVAPLNRLGVRYFVTGALAAGMYGEPRLTNDVDLVVELSERDAVNLHDAFDASAFYVPPLDVMLAERSRARHGHFNLIHHETAYKADVYLVGDDPLHRWGLERREQVTVDGEPVWLAPPEYVIIRKLQFYRDGGSAKHLRDVRSMVSVLGARIDRAALEEQVAAHGLASEWANVAEIN